MKAELTFDCYYDDFDHIEGCYRLPGEDWKVFYLARVWKGKLWDGPREIQTGVVWRSGITGVQGRIPKWEPLTPFVAAQIIGDALGVTWWAFVPGPNSLLLK
jgi:hypothetical protein